MIHGDRESLNELIAHRSTNRLAMIILTILFKLRHSIIRLRGGSPIDRLVVE